MNVNKYRWVGTNVSIFFYKYKQSFIYVSSSLLVYVDISLCVKNNRLCINYLLYPCVNIVVLILLIKILNVTLIELLKSPPGLYTQGKWRNNTGGQQLVIRSMNRKRIIGFETYVRPLPVHLIYLLLLNLNDPILYDF